MTRLLILYILATLNCFAIESFGPTHAFSVNPIKHPASFKHFDYVNPKAPKTGNLVLAGFGSFNNFNPFIMAGVSASGLSFTFETLGMQSYNEENTVYGLIAESFEFDKEQGIFIVKLHKHVQFQNGDPVTADDIITTYNTLIKQGHPIYKQLFNDIKQIKKIDDRTIGFYAIENYNQDMPFNIATSLPVLSKKDLQSRDFENTTLTPLIATGPYTIKDFKLGQKIVYQRNPNYWGTQLAVNQGRNNFSQITYKYFRDQSISLTAFKAGHYNWRMENIAKFWATQYVGQSFKQGLIKKEEIKTERPNGMQAFAMNIRKAPFNDPKVREALNLAFNYKWLNENLFYSSYVRSKSFFNNSQFSATKAITPEEKALLQPFYLQLPEEIWQTTFEFSPLSPHENLIKAQQLLNETDWTLQGKHRIHKTTKKPLVFTLLTNSSAMNRVALPYKKTLESIGITMNIQLISPSNWISRMKHFDFDMTTYSWPAPISPGSEQFLFWHSSLANIPGSSNIMGINNPAVDQLVTTIQQADDHQTLINNMRALDRILMWSYYVIPHWYIDYERVAYWQCISPPKKHPIYGIDIMSWYQKSPCNIKND